MNILVNGEPKTCEDGCTVATLLAELGADRERVAVVVNENVVVKSEHRRRMLAAGDRVEVLTFAGGG
jgi:thiamine biosynthesis protein ThiS